MLIHSGTNLINWADTSWSPAMVFPTGPATTPVSQSFASDWEALLGLAVSSPPSWEALKPLAVTTPPSWESLVLASAAASPAWESLVPAAGSYALPWEALKPLAVSSAPSWESLLPARAETVVSFESLLAAAMQAAPSWEALAIARLSAVNLWESLGPVLGASSASYESLVPVAAAMSPAWESLIPALLNAVASWESLVSAASVHISDWEALQPVAIAFIPPWESLLPVGLLVVSYAVEYEALSPVVTASVTAYESLMPVSSLEESAFEALRSLSGEYVIPWESLLPAAVPDVIGYFTGRFIVRPSFTGLLRALPSFSGGLRMRSAFTGRFLVRPSFTGRFIVNQPNEGDVAGGPVSVSMSSIVAWESLKPVTQGAVVAWESLLPTGTPMVTNGLRVWLKADALTLSDTDPVSSFTDSSGLGNHGTQSGTSRPQFRTNQVNGLPAVDFDGGDDYFDLPDALFSGMTEGEVFIVLKVDADPPASVPETGLWSMDNGASGMGASHIPFIDGNVYDAWGSLTRQATGNPTLSFASWRIYSVVSKAGEWTSRVNGVQHFTTATNTVEFPPNGVLLGKSWNRSLSFFYLNGMIAEFAIYDSVLNTTDRAQVVQHLTEKYAL